MSGTGYYVLPTIVLSSLILLILVLTLPVKHRNVIILILRLVIVITINISVNKLKVRVHLFNDQHEEFTSIYQNVNGIGYRVIDYYSAN
jgi:hypothetical protein